jgi:hypothetical protein
MRKMLAWLAGHSTVAAIILVAAVSLAVAANTAGPANFAGIFGSGLHGTPSARMGCDASTPQNCGLGAVAIDSFGNYVDQRKTYHYSVTGLTPVATPTDIIRVCGASTATVKIKRIWVGGKATTGGQMPLAVLRETGAGTVGSATFTAVTAAQHDINAAAPAEVVNYVQTANYGTVPTLVAQIGVMRAYLNVAATGPSTPAVWDFTRSIDQPLFLRGTADCIAINGTGGAVPAGGVLDFEIETENDNT